MDGYIIRDDFESWEDIWFNAKFELCFVVCCHVQVDGLCAWVERDRFIVADMDEWSWVDVGEWERVEVCEAAVDDDLVDAVVRAYEEVVCCSLEDWVLDGGETDDERTLVVDGVSCDVESVSNDLAVDYRCEFSCCSWAAYSSVGNVVEFSGEVDENSTFWEDFGDFVVHFET